jgi:hypothetical protein
VLLSSIDVTVCVTAFQTVRWHSRRGAVAGYTFCMQAMIHDDAYVVHFAAGHQVRATRDDLTILRIHAPEHSLGEREVAVYEPYVVYRVIVGSHAYGLADEHSDRSLLGLYAC